MTQPTVKPPSTEAPLWVWAVVGIIVVITALVWYVRIGRQAGFESPELNQHYIHKLNQLDSIRQGRTSSPWIIAIGRSDMDYALPEFNPYNNIGAQPPLLLQKIILFSALLADFDRLLPPIIKVKPQLILIDYDLLFEDATAFRNASYTLDFIRSRFSGKAHFRPHGGSFPDYTDRDAARCKQKKFSNPEQIANLVQRQVHLLNLKQVRRSDGASARRAQAFFEAAAARGIKLAAVQLPVHPELEQQRRAASVFNNAAETAKMREWEQRFGLTKVQVSDDWPSHFFCDPTHMTQAGKEKFWREIKPRLAELLVQSP